MAGNGISRQSSVQILEIMHRLAAPDSMPDLLREIINVGKVAIVAEAGALWLFDRPTQMLKLVAPSLNPVPQLALGEALAGTCAQSMVISNISDARSDDLYRQHVFADMDSEVRAILNVPIRGREGNLLGVMQWFGENTDQFDAHDEWIGPALAAQAAVAIQHAYMTDELLATAILDKEVAVAREIQISTLPQTMPHVHPRCRHYCRLFLGRWRVSLFSF